MHYKLAQLILTPTTKNGSSSEVFISQPDAIKENLVGKILVLVEIESRDNDCLKFINFLINELNRNYYNNEKAILRERVSTIKIEQVFEAALAKTNKNIAEFIQASALEIDFRQINATIAVVHEDGLHFSIIGKNRAFLIHKNKTDGNDAKYRLIDLTSQAKIESEALSLNSHKLFSNIVSGSIPQNGYFIFTNEALPEYLSGKQLTEIITTLPPASAVEQIKNQLNQVNAYVSFLGIIIKNTLGQTTQEKIRPVLATSTAHASIASLKTTEEATEKLLTPSGIVDFKTWFGKMRTGLGSSRSGSGDLTRQEKLLLADKLSFGKRASFKFLKIFWQNLKTGSLYLIQILLHLPKFLNRQNISELAEGGKTNLKSKIGRTLGWFGALTKKQKIFIAAASVFILLFVYNSVILGYRNKKNDEQRAFDAIAASIEQKENQIESNLIFKNDDGARKLLNEIKPLLEQLPATNERFAALKSKYEEQNKKINRLSSVASDEMANFANLNSQAKPGNLALINGKLYAGDKDNQTIYVLDLASKLVTAIKNFPEAPLNLNSPTVNAGKLYYYNGDAIWELDTQTEALTKLSLEFSGSTETITSISYYNGRLYALSPANNQIYRFSKSANQFGNSTEWLSAKPDLDQASAMTIDGSIYVLKNGDRLFKFLRGAKQDFSLGQVHPPLAAISKINATTKSIYLLEPQNKRLLAFDKGGKLVNQYYLENENDLKDFAINETENKAYLLGGSRVIEIKL